jgi:hypothetical protein
MKLALDAAPLGLKVLGMASDEWSAHELGIRARARVNPHPNPNPNPNPNPSPSPSPNPSPSLTLTLTRSSLDPAAAVQISDALARQATVFESVLRSHLAEQVRTRARARARARARVRVRVRVRVSTL